MAGGHRVGREAPLTPVAEPGQSCGEREVLAGGRTPDPLEPRRPVLPLSGCRRWVARGTARRALAELEGAGLVEAVHGKGRYVRRR